MPFLANLPWPKEVLEANSQATVSFFELPKWPMKIISAFHAPGPKLLQPITPSHTLPRPPWLSPYFRPIQPEDEVTTQSKPFQPEIPLLSTLPQYRSTFVVKIPKVQPFDPTDSEDKAHSISGVLGSLYCHLWNCDPTCTILQGFPPNSTSTRFTLPVLGPLSPTSDFPTSLEHLQGYLLDLDPPPRGSSAYCRVHLAYSLPTFELLSKLNGKDMVPHVFVKGWKQNIARHIAHKANARASQQQDLRNSKALLDRILPPLASPSATERPQVQITVRKKPYTMEQLEHHWAAPTQSPNKTQSMLPQAARPVPKPPRQHSAIQPLGLRWLLAVFGKHWMTSWDTVLSGNLW